MIGIRLPGLTLTGTRGTITAQSGACTLKIGVNVMGMSSIILFTMILHSNMM